MLGFYTLDATQTVTAYRCAAQHVARAVGAFEPVVD